MSEPKKLNPLCEKCIYAECEDRHNLAFSDCEDRVEVGDVED